MTERTFNGPYAGEYLERVAFPLGGIGAGMICLEGAGAISHVSVRGEPQVFNEPLMFAAISVKGRPHGARLLEGPVPQWKVMFPWGHGGSGNGSRDKTFGLPHCQEAEFEARFPFGRVKLREPHLPLAIEICGWSPFTPPDADRSSLPVAALEYRFRNQSDEAIEAVFSFHAVNFMSAGPGQGFTRRTVEGFALCQGPAEERAWDEGAFAVEVDDPARRVNAAWFRGGWFDAFTMAWKSVEDGAAIDADPPAEGATSPGASLFVPFRLEAGAEKTIRLRFAWYVPRTNLRIGESPEGAVAACCAPGESCTTDTLKPATHVPWYAGRFGGVDEVAAYWRAEYDTLRAESAAFSECFFDMTLPPEVIEAVAANLSILKSPTVQRQTDGRLWCWEGCCDANGCCHGSCTHVWNYTQAIPHLFPALERSLRETEFGVSQDERGHQNFRTNIPISPGIHNFHAAADGQLGGIMKVHREWRISGDSLWLRAMWPRVRQSLDYCIATWDPQHRGLVEEPHHNTYDIEFWGADGMGTSVYLGALRAAAAMAAALGEDAAPYEELLAKGREAMEARLWNGDYFIQETRRAEEQYAGDDAGREKWLAGYSPEARALIEREGPNYQYGAGCLSDGVIGEWFAAACGVGGALDPEKVRGHLLAVHRHNFKPSLRDHANPQRPTYALGEEAGLLLCTWPRGGQPSLPFVYSNEVWTGIEYQVASHLMMTGCAEEGLEIVRACRARYDGQRRNPFDEFECGHWYARALASWALLQGMTGARYDAVTKTLTLEPRIAGDFRVFLATATGYGTAGVENGEPFVKAIKGAIEVKAIDYTPLGE